MLAVLAGTLFSVVGAARPASAAAFVPISGAGSTWSNNAFLAWTGNVAQFGMVVNYAPVGSTAGRVNFKQGTVDFAASDIPYGVVDGLANDPPPTTRGFTYVPDTAGAVTFMYNLKVGGNRVTNLRLSGDTIAKIFTGVVTRWNDPAIAADNPGISLPAIAIVPVVRSDGSGLTYQFTQWMAATESQYWTAYCAKVGRSPCTPTSAYPVLAGSSMIAQAGDTAGPGYISQDQAVGAIGYVEYANAVQLGFPVSKVLNSAGYYTEPTASNVGLSLLAAKINPDQTQDLSGVYTDPDPRTYELSKYSYLIVPTDTNFGFTAARGLTLGDFGQYLLCQGQQVVNQLGYAALPVNLVTAGYTQLQTIQGSQLPATATQFLQGCADPTISQVDGTDILAATDPMPQPCDHLGDPTQCSPTVGDTQGETIDVNVPLSEGVFTMSVSTTPIVLSTAVLSADSTTFSSTGQLSAVTISDGRQQSRPGWSISCQVSDFSSGAQSFSGSHLGWSPAITTPDPANDVSAGLPVAAGTIPGLAGGSLLAAATPNRGLGTTVLGAGLDLKVPADTQPGTYSATLTVTAVESG
jgi:phosphate ABC transporter phosphate-binding protein